MKFTSKELAEKFNLNHARLKRWTRNFLPNDLKAGLRSGYTREYGERDVLVLFLCYYLVGICKFSILDTKKIISEIYYGIQEVYQHYRNDDTGATSRLEILTTDGLSFRFFLEENFRKETIRWELHHPHATLKQKPDSINPISWHLDLTEIFRLFHSATGEDSLSVHKGKGM